MNDHQRKNQDFNRFAQAIEGLEEFDARLAYRALIGALKQSVSVKDFSESIDIAIDIVNDFKTSIEEVSTSEKITTVSSKIMGINTTTYVMGGRSHEKKSVA